MNIHHEIAMHILFRYGILRFYRRGRNGNNINLTIWGHQLEFAWKERNITVGVGSDERVLVNFNI